VCCTGLRREIQRVAQDYDYDWKGQLENLEDTSPATLRSANGSSDQQVLRNSVPGQATTAASATESQHGAEKTDVVSLSDAPTSADDQSSIDVDATINEAVELEEQTRLEQKRRHRGKGGKGEIMEVDQQKG
jgi:hypothetical protein